MSRDGAIIGAAAIAALLLLARSAKAAPSPSLTVRFPIANDTDNAPASDNAPTGFLNTPETNVIAFIQMLRFAEHSAADVRSGADFGTFYGGSRFTNFADHPAKTGEKQGVPLPESMCRAAGFGAGCVSTAAGALQINLPTWDDGRGGGLRNIPPRLPDFSPASQIEAGRRLLDEIGAGRLIRAGDFQGALRLAAARWASLPGSQGGQGKGSFDFVAQTYIDAGGNLA